MQFQNIQQEKKSSNEPISGPIVLLLYFLKDQPQNLDKLLLPEKSYPLTLLYMHEQNLCTVIDVDELNQKIKIKNFTQNTMFKAFGNVENPDFAMYTEFLKSRCFPESRDKV